MSFRKIAFGITLSSAVLGAVTVLPARVSAQCANGGASVKVQSKTGAVTDVQAEKSATTDGAPDFVIQAETGMTPRTFEHESFTLKSIVKSSVSFYPSNAKSDISAYENLWYHDGQPIGLERSSMLKIPADKNVGIKIVQSPCAGYDESRAAGNTILRLVLDILKNHDKVASVSVPSASYTNVLMELQRRRMSVMPPGEKAPEAAKIKFKLESESTGLTQEVYFI